MTALKVLHARQSSDEVAHGSPPMWQARYSANTRDEETEDNSAAFDFSPTGQSPTRDQSLKSPKGLDTYVFPAISAEFQQFAQWAFGPEGFKSLEAIFCGDFSRGSRLEKHNLILLRQQPPSQIEQPSRLQNFIRVSSNYAPLQPYFDKYRTALEACPVELRPMYDPSSGNQ